MSAAAIWLALFLAIGRQGALDCRPANVTTDANFPWYVTFVNSFGKPEFGGAIITDGVVLTAAYRIASVPDPIQSFKAKLEMSDLCQMINTGKTFSIAKVIVHDNYSLANPSLDNIALVFLEGDTSMFAPIHLTQATWRKGAETVGTAGLVMGFGINDSPSCKMRVATVPIYPKALCDIYTGRFPSKNAMKSQLCAGNLEPFQCLGDPGSPLVVETEPNRREIVGLVSFNYDELKMECHSSKVAFFTNVEDYKFWIREKLLKSLEISKEDPKGQKIDSTDETHCSDVKGKSPSSKELPWIQQTSPQKGTVIPEDFLLSDPNSNTNPNPKPNFNLNSDSNALLIPNFNKNSNSEAAPHEMKSISEAPKSKVDLIQDDDVDDDVPRFPGHLIGIFSFIKENSANLEKTHGAIKSAFKDMHKKLRQISPEPQDVYLIKSGMM